MCASNLVVKVPMIDRRGTYPPPPGGWGRAKLSTGLPLQKKKLRAWLVCALHGCSFPFQNRKIILNINQNVPKIITVFKYDFWSKNIIHKIKFTFLHYLCVSLKNIYSSIRVFATLSSAMTGIYKQVKCHLSHLFKI